MYGLTIRWSLHAATTDLAQRLRDYAAEEGAGRLAGRPGLVQVIWTLREGGSFGATTVWSSDSARQAFLAEFRSAGSPVTRLLGHRPDAVEEFEVIDVASAEAITLPEARVAEAQRTES